MLEGELAVNVSDQVGVNHVVLFEPNQNARETGFAFVDGAVPIGIIEQGSFDATMLWRRCCSRCIRSRRSRSGASPSPSVSRSASAC